jgi:hypothetical protein
LQPFAVHEQDEILEQMGKTIPVVAQPPDPPEPHGLFHGYRHCGRGRVREAPDLPPATGPACDCLTAEEHLSGACA